MKTKQQVREEIEKICESYTQSGFLDSVSDFEKEFIDKIMAIFAREQEETRRETLEYTANKLLQVAHSYSGYEEFFDDLTNQLPE